MNNRSKLDGFNPKTIEDCVTAPSETLAIAAKSLIESDGLTVRQLAAKMGMHKTTARGQIDYLLVRKFIYIDHWDKTHAHAWSAVFKVGNKPNAAVPAQRTTIKVENPKLRPKAEKPEPKPFMDEISAAHLTALTKALIPVRTPEEQYAVNWAYWDYMARRAA